VPDRRDQPLKIGQLFAVEGSAARSMNPGSENLGLCTFLSWEKHVESNARSEAGTQAHRLELQEEDGSWNSVLHAWNKADRDGDSGHHSLSLVLVRP
jgi:hypothetical protein